MESSSLTRIDGNEQTGAKSKEWAKANGVYHKARQSYHWVSNVVNPETGNIAAVSMQVSVYIIDWKVIVSFLWHRTWTPLNTCRGKREC